MIEVKDLKKNYLLGKTTIPALQGISMKINKGEFVSVVGPSGSGKSTLLNIIGLLDKPSEGQVLIDDRNVEKHSSVQLADIRAKKIGFIFQAFNLIPVFNVYENIEMSLALSKEKYDKRNWKERIYNAIKEVELEKFIKHKPNELSGGQRQRVAIARALIKRPEIIIADEPTANLDSKTTFSIVELMKKLNKLEKVTFVFSTHDDRVLKYLDRIIRLEDGQIKAET
jgi:putative ABC transport system ATP-binding protein